MTINTFKRYELKYIINKAQYHALKDILEHRMTTDEYCADTGSYMIYNLYYDTEDDILIRRSLEKPYYKEKLRLRSYKMPTGKGEAVFLEIKKKINGIVAKRRSVLNYDEAVAFILTGKPPTCDTYKDAQVVSEISDFLSRYPVFPKVFISYERNAYFDKTDADLRVSFDKKILTRRDGVNLYEGDYGSELLTDDTVIMEIKCKGAVPLWLCHILSEMCIYKTGFSKYGEEYLKHIGSDKSRCIITA